MSESMTADLVARLEAGEATVKERPILFSGPMVRALLDGRKTQTRRIVKPQPHHGPVGQMVNLGGPDWAIDDGDLSGQWHCPYGVPGDRLWVKETWRPSEALQPWDLEVTYHADGTVRTIKDGEFGERDWTMPKAAARGNVSPLFMPRWASRLTLEITGVRVERLQDISEADAIAEGPGFVGKLTGEVCESVAAHRIGIGPRWKNARDWYADLWEEINGPSAWQDNPWVWAVSFNVLRAKGSDQ